VSGYDIFIGSGTSIIQSASLGVCSIVGIESMERPLTYGFFYDVAKFDYNLKSLNLPLFEVEYLLSSFFHMSADEKKMLVRKHIECCNEFSMEKCSENFENTKLEIVELNKRNPLVYVLYDLSRCFSAIFRRFYKKHPLNSTYDRK